MASLTIAIVLMYVCDMYAIHVHMLTIAIVVDSLEVVELRGEAG